MDPRVAQFEHASLQRCHESLRVQQGRVKSDTTLVVWRSARRIGCLLLYLGPCQIYGESSNVDHSLHTQEWTHAVEGREWVPPQRKSETATARLQEREPSDSPTP